jgi:hypothetical protein
MASFTRMIGARGANHNVKKRTPAPAFEQKTRPTPHGRRLVKR